MKLLLLLPLSAALLVTSCGEKSSSEGSDSAGASAEPSADTDVERLLKEAVDVESLEERDGLIYQDNTPYSGWVKAMHNPEQVAILAQAKDGKPDGPKISWHENGQKMEEGTHKHGEQDGIFRSWHENGQKRSEETYKDGKSDGPYTWWHENGQKRSEGTYKDGEIDGLHTGWHENGQKWNERTFKDGEEVSAKYWNSKGEEVAEEESWK
jgi:antitoxin component YwqK of YwqJK toxin-antitoxin module